MSSASVITVGTPWTCNKTMPWATSSSSSVQIPPIPITSTGTIDTNELTALAKQAQQLGLDEKLTLIHSYGFVAGKYMELAGSAAA